MPRAQKRKRIEAVDLEEKKNEIEYEEEEENNCLIELHSDALKHVLEFLSLADRTKHIAFTCKRLNTLSKDAKIYYKYFNENMLKNLNEHPNAINVGKKLKVETLYVSPKYNMELMCVLAASTQCLIASNWDKEPLYFICSNASGLCFGSASACKMLTTHEKPLSQVSFTRSISSNNGTRETCEVLTTHEWSALEKCIKCINLFELRLDILIEDIEQRTTLCRKSLLQVTNLAIQVSSKWWGVLDLEPDGALLVKNTYYLPQLQSLEIQLKTASLRWSSLEMPNLKRLMINVVGLLAVESTGVEEIRISHVLDCITLIMNTTNCKTSLKRFQLQTKQLEIVFDHYNPHLPNEVVKAELYKFIGMTNCNLQYESLMMTSHTDYFSNDEINREKYFVWHNIEL